MALTVGEDSYVSLSDADTFWTENSGSENWDTASNTDKEKALRQATQYIDKRFRWIGNHPGGSGQLLAWPRNNAIDKQGRFRSGIPQEVKDATAYLADKVLDSALLGPKSRGGAVESVKAGSVQVQFSKHASAHTSYDYVDLLVSDLIVGSGANARMVKV